MEVLLKCHDIATALTLLPTLGVHHELYRFYAACLKPQAYYLYTSVVHLHAELFAVSSEIV